MQDPGSFLTTLEIELPGAMNRRNRAVLENEYLSMVNYEFFYFSDIETKKRFDRKPWEYCGVVTDPVTRARFLPDKSSLHFDFEGKPYFFLNDSTLAAFEDDPQMFALPLYEMPEPEDES